MSVDLDRRPASVDLTRTSAACLGLVPAALKGGRCAGGGGGVGSCAAASEDSVALVKFRVLRLLPVLLLPPALLPTPALAASSTACWGAGLLDREGPSSVLGGGTLPLRTTGWRGGPRDCGRFGNLDSEAAFRGGVACGCGLGAPQPGTAGSFPGEWCSIGASSRRAGTLWARGVPWARGVLWALPGWLPDGRLLAPSGGTEETLPRGSGPPPPFPEAMATCLRWSW